MTRTGRLLRLMQILCRHRCPVTGAALAAERDLNPDIR